MNHEITAKAVEDLYQVCQLFQIIRDILADLKDQLDYLATVLGQCNPSLHFPLVPGDELDDTSVDESLNFLRSKNQILIRWVVNYTERTEVQINRLFSHATHKDSAINLNISQLTSKIAVSSQRDSSAMITMAAVTMFFLPGTFVSVIIQSSIWQTLVLIQITQAFFSMVFFNSQTNTAGKTSFYVAPQWWIFPAVTIPLTICVFVIWMIWRHLRDKKRLGELISARRTGTDCCGHVQEIS
ncbi:hypothetical protein GALMADRAFT_225529 [Galerina marginata CBS 339.88]|uniref:Uncharacterized protein n=1 Tax=Galerina marginata (strain CBS 339.88) TaxID=685588 RepID=A0A067TBY8_GALM3|nr:hypothetical protein GALMADRAFT_225529 [Galerina marginata CBS 339.88]